jgi:transposase
MVALSVDRKEYHILRSFPGLVMQTTCKIIGELGDLRRFKNVNNLINTLESILCVINQELQKILYFMIFSMISLRKKGNNHIIDYYDKLKKQPQRKPHKVAVIAWYK